MNTPTFPPSSGFGTDRKAAQHHRLTRLITADLRSGIWNDSRLEWSEQTAEETFTTSVVTDSNGDAHLRTEPAPPLIQANPHREESVFKQTALATSITVSARCDLALPAPYLEVHFETDNLTRPIQRFVPDDRRLLTPMLRLMLGAISATENSGTRDSAAEESNLPVRHVNLTSIRTAEQRGQVLTTTTHLRWSVNHDVLELIEMQALPGAALWTDQQRTLLPLDLIGASVRAGNWPAQVVPSERQAAFYHDMAALLNDIKLRNERHLDVHVHLGDLGMLTLIDREIKHHTNQDPETEQDRLDLQDDWRATETMQDFGKMPAITVTLPTGNQAMLATEDSATSGSAKITIPVPLELSLLLILCFRDWQKGGKTAMSFAGYESSRTTYLTFLPVNDLQIAVLHKKRMGGRPAVTLLDHEDALRPLMASARNALNGDKSRKDP